MSLSRYTRQNTSLSLFVPKRIPRVISKIVDTGIKLPSLSKQYNQINSFVEPTINKQPKAEKQNKEIEIDGDLSPTLSVLANRKVLMSEKIFSPIPNLPSPKTDEFEEVLKAKIDVCNVIFNFTKSNIQKVGKNMKYQALQELNNLFMRKNDLQLLTDEQLNLIYQMIYANIFEQDPLIAFSFASAPSEIVDPSWPHLDQIFQLLTLFHKHFKDYGQLNLELAKKTILMTNLPDPNVRERLSAFLIEYVKAHPDQIQAIIKAIRIALMNVAEKIYTPYCVAPLINVYLFIWTTNKQELSMHVPNIANECILPLYHVEKLSNFAIILNSFMIRIVSETPQMQQNALIYLIKTFPVQNGTRQQYFIKAIYNLIRNMQPRHYKCYAEYIFHFFAKCIESPNSTLLESVVKFFSSNHASPLITNNAKQAITILYLPFYKAAQRHWDKAIREKLVSAMSVLKRVDSTSFISIEKDFQLMIAGSSNSESNTIKGWANIAREATKRDNSVNLTEILQKAHLAFMKEPPLVLLCRQSSLVTTSRMTSSRMTSSRDEKDLSALSSPLVKSSCSKHANSQQYRLPSILEDDCA